jgi:hypothetical protein
MFAVRAHTPKSLYEGPAEDGLPKSSADNWSCLGVDRGWDEWSKSLGKSRLNPLLFPLIFGFQPACLQTVSKTANRPTLIQKADRALDRGWA